MANHGVKHDEQLAHARGQRDFRFLAGAARKRRQKARNTGFRRVANDGLPRTDALKSL